MPSSGRHPLPSAERFATAAGGAGIGPSVLVVAYGDMGGADAQELEGSGVIAVSLNPGIIDTEMLRSCFGSGAAHYPDPEAWVKSAGPFLLSLGVKQHGRSVNVPDVPTE